MYLVATYGLLGGISVALTMVNTNTKLVVLQTLKFIAKKTRFTWIEILFSFFHISGSVSTYSPLLVSWPQRKGTLPLHNTFYTVLRWTFLKIKNLHHLDKGKKMIKRSCSNHPEYHVIRSLESSLLVSVFLPQYSQVGEYNLALKILEVLISVKEPSIKEILILL